MNAYIWLCWQNGIRVRGAIYNMIRKKLPTVPKLLKNGELSRAVNISTDRRTYSQAVIDNNLNMEDYEEYISTLPEGEFFKQEWLTRSPRFVQTFEESLTGEVREMLSTKTSLYPNFHKECSFCDYKSLCRTQSDRGDFKLLMKLDYEVMESTVAIRRES
jgi:hypothetical protein